MSRRPVPEFKPDGFLAFQWRRLMTGLCWACFGLGGLGLTLTWFPWINAVEKDPARRVRRARAVIAASFRLFMRLCEVLGVARYDVEDVRALRKVRGAIIVANHPTILDYVLICSQLPGMDCLVKAELTRNFFLKGVVRAADYLLNNQSEEILGDCRTRLGRGDNILIFPEGTRTVPGRPLKLKRGVAHIALRLGRPLQVVHIRCSGRWLDKSSAWWEIPRTRPVITLRMGEPINPADFLREGEEGYSLASRRLTRELTRVLSINNENNPK